MKARLRRHMLSLRDKIDACKHEELSKIISQKLSSFNCIRDAKCIMAYFSFRGEVDLTYFFDYCRQHGKCICLPRVGGKGVMTAVEYTKECTLKPNRYGIPEPSGTRVIDKDIIDVKIVPSVAFDKHLHRLGYGGGYYDRFLEDSGAVKIGVCFDFQVTDKLPRQKHDKEMDIVVTEQRTFGERL